MTARGSVAVSLLALALLAGPALAYAAEGPSDKSARSIEPNSAFAAGSVSQQLANATVNATNASGPSFGGQISAFMQSNAVTANGSVENGMWTARVAASNGSDRAKSVTKRIAVLERRQDQLRSQLDRFANDRTNVSDPATAAQVSRLTTRIQMLRSTVNETAGVAAEVGVNETKLERLRTNAANMTGHEVAALARNLSMGPPAGVPGGPPAKVGPPGHGAMGPPNGSVGPPDNGTMGPPDGSPGHSGNETTGQPNGPEGSPGNGGNAPPDNSGGSSDSDSGGGGPPN